MSISEVHDDDPSQAWVKGGGLEVFDFLALDGGIPRKCQVWPGPLHIISSEDSIELCDAHI